MSANTSNIHALLDGNDFACHVPVKYSKLIVNLFPSNLDGLCLASNFLIPCRLMRTSSIP